MIYKSVVFQKSILGFITFPSEVFFACFMQHSRVSEIMTRVDLVGVRLFLHFMHILLILPCFYILKMLFVKFYLQNLISIS